MSPRIWQELAKAIERPSEVLDRLCLWAWRGYHQAEQRASGAAWERAPGTGDRTVDQQLPAAR